MVHTARQTSLLRDKLAERIQTVPLIEYAMSIGSPSIGEVLREMKEQGCERILVLPLYPQYASSSTASAFDEVFAQLGKENVGRVDVICPGFVSDCLETLEEIAMEGKTIFMQAGGREFHYIPCLNERADWIDVLADIALENLHGWLRPTPNQAELVQSRQRALAMGADD